LPLQSRRRLSSRSPCGPCGPTGPTEDGSDQRPVQTSREGAYRVLGAPLKDTKPKLARSKTTAKTTRTRPLQSYIAHIPDGRALDSHVSYIPLEALDSVGSRCGKEKARERGRGKGGRETKADENERSAPPSDQGKGSTIPTPTSVPASPVAPVCPTGPRAPTIA
jgi:hypothetical protein